MKHLSLFKTIGCAGVATLVLAVQAASAEPLVYVPLGGDNKIMIVDAANDEIVGEVGGVAAVHGLAGTPDGKFLIAGSYEERERGAGAVVKPSDVTADEHAAHHSAAPTDLPKDKKAAVSTVSIVRISDRSVVRRVDVPGVVHHVAVSPNGRFAIVTHPDEGSVSAIDLATYEVVANIATGPLPNYAAFSPDGSQVFVSNAGNNTLSAIDTGQWSISWSAVTGASPEHVVSSKDGAMLYVNNVDDGSVSVIDVSQNKVVKTIPIGATLHGIDLSDDGGTLFVAALGDDRIVAVDLANGTSRGAGLAPAPYHLAVVRGTGKLYISSADEPKIWVVDQGTLAVRGEIPIAGKGHQMVMSPGT